MLWPRTPKCLHIQLFPALRMPAWYRHLIITDSLLCHRDLETPTFSLNSTLLIWTAQYYIQTLFMAPSEGCPIHPHHNGPYKPCVDPYGSMRCTLRMSTDCMDRTNHNALCPDVIMRCTLRMSLDRMNRNALCPDVIMRCTLRMCSAYGPWVIVTVCAERTVR